VYTFFTVYFCFLRIFATKQWLKFISTVRALVLMKLIYMKKNVQLILLW